jgi:pilus assembly protein Flp/PilA
MEFIKSLSERFSRFTDQTERGQGLVEYALILSLVAVVVIIMLTLLGSSINEIYFTVMCPIQFNAAQVYRNPGDNNLECRAGGVAAGLLFAVYDADTNNITVV